MKKILLFMAFCLGLTFSVSAQSQYDNKDAIKAAKRERKAALEQVNAKAPKIARKDAKKYKKQGWLVTPGSLPLEKQLERSYIMEFEVDDELYPKYIVATSMSVGETYDAAKLSAINLAKEQLAGQLQTEITSLIESTVANEQLSREEAASITQTVMASKNLISQSLGRTIPIVDAYRETRKGDCEVLVRVVYSHDAAWNTAKKAVVTELEKKGDNLHKKLEELMF